MLNSTALLNMHTSQTAFNLTHHYNEIKSLQCKVQELFDKVYEERYGPE